MQLCTVLVTVMGVAWVEGTCCFFLRGVSWLIEIVILNTYSESGDLSVRIRVLNLSTGQISRWQKFRHRLAKSRSP